MYSKVRSPPSPLQLPCELTVGYVRSIVHFWSRISPVEEWGVLGKAALPILVVVRALYTCNGLSPTATTASPSRLLVIWQMWPVLTFIVLLVCIVGRESPPTFIHFV